MTPLLPQPTTHRNSRVTPRLPFPARWCARRFALAPSMARTVAAHAFPRWEAR